MQRPPCNRMSHLQILCLNNNKRWVPLVTLPFIHKRKEFLPLRKSWSIFKKASLNAASYFLSANAGSSKSFLCKYWPEYFATAAPIIEWGKKGCTNQWSGCWEVRCVAFSFINKIKRPYLHVHQIQRKNLCRYSQGLGLWYEHLP